MHSQRENILVTGGAGFIGSHLVDALVAAGYAVMVIDNLANGSHNNLNQAAVFLEGSVLDNELLAGVIPGVSCVFHLAALASVPQSSERPKDAHAANV